MRLINSAQRQRRRGLWQLGRGALLLLVLLKAASSYGLESPEYEVLYAQDDIEYRRYAPFTVAETGIDAVGSQGKDSRDGFMRLFNYITGSNESRTDIAMTSPVIESTARSEKIAMTSPVIESGSAGRPTVAFMLPSEYDLDSAPLPTDDAVSLRVIPERLVVSIRYSGRWTQKNVAKHKARLDAHLAEAGVRPIGDFQTAVYNPPFTPPFLRRNEIHYEVAALPASAER